MKVSQATFSGTPVPMMALGFGWKGSFGFSLWILLSYVDTLYLFMWVNTGDLSPFVDTWDK